MMSHWFVLHLHLAFILLYLEVRDPIDLGK